MLKLTWKIFCIYLQKVYAFQPYWPITQSALFKTINEMVSEQAGSVNCNIPFRGNLVLRPGLRGLCKVVGVMSGLWHEWPKNQGLVSERAEILFLSRTF